MDLNKLLNVIVSIVPVDWKIYEIDSGVTMEETNTLIKEKKSDASYLI